jgi:hypothetical protein
MGTSLGRGGVAGCLWNGCLAVPALALLVVCGLWVGLAVAGHRGESEAHGAMARQAALTRSRLAGSARDGVLLGTEIDRDVRTGRVLGPVRVRRQGGTVTVTARLEGFGPGAMGRTEATGCYRFRIVAVRATSARVPDTSCAAPASALYRPPGQVADDVVAEVRAALGKGGVEAVRVAPVWRTPGIDVVNVESSPGKLDVTFRLLEPGVSLRSQCYVVDVRQAPSSVALRKPAAGRCG